MIAFWWLAGALAKAAMASKMAGLSKMAGVASQLGTMAQGAKDAVAAAPAAGGTAQGAPGAQGTAPPAQAPAGQVQQMPPPQQGLTQGTMQALSMDRRSASGAPDPSKWDTFKDDANLFAKSYVSNYLDSYGIDPKAGFVDNLKSAAMKYASRAGAPNSDKTTYQQYPTPSQDDDTAGRLSDFVKIGVWDDEENRKKSKALF